MRLTIQKRLLFLWWAYIFHPANPKLITSTGGAENLIILRYGQEKGKKYLSFSNINEDKSIQINCDTKIFFSHVFSGKSSNECSKEEINSFRKVFVDQHESGTWYGKKMTVHYSIGNDQSLLFVFDDDGKGIKIDTDFISKNDLKNMAKDIFEKE